MRFLIMRSDPVFIDDTGNERSVPDRPGELLRLLLLHRQDDVAGGRPTSSAGRPLEKATAALHMPAQKTTKTTTLGQPIDPSAIQGLKSAVEKAIGKEWIATVKSAYRLDVDPAAVDAFAFQQKIDELGVLKMHDVEDADPDKLETLRRVRAMWHGNPVDKFNASPIELFALQYNEFNRSYERLQLALIYTLLHGGTHGELGEALSLLTAAATSAGEAADDEVWSLLIRVQGSLPGFVRAIPETLRFIEQEVGDVPEPLQELAERVLGREADLLFGDQQPRGRHSSAVASGVPDAPDATALEAIAMEVGISVQGSSLRLHGGKTEPVACIEATHRRLYFSGILASKWVASRYERTRLELLLSRLDDEGGDVRFLILDPESESYERYCELTDSAEGPESVPYLLDFSARHESFAVRMFDALPTFRIVVLDEDVVSVAPYLLQTYDHSIQGHQGWDVPHVALTPFAPWPLARSFEALFLEQWRIARPIEELS